MPLPNDDIENRVVEQALRDGELHRALLDHLEVGIYMVDLRRRILYWNRAAEQITGYLSQEVTGQFCFDDLMMHCDGAGRGLCGKACPLSNVMLDGKARECTIFLRHRHGHRLPVNIRSRAIHDSEGAIIGAVEVFENAKAAAAVDRPVLEAHGCLDPLTGVANRAYGEFKLGQALATLETFGVPFAWIGADLENVEELEHRYGHGIVDAAMKMMAKTLESNVGHFDKLTRWGKTAFRIEAHSFWQPGLAELIAKLVTLSRASNLDWWGDPVRVTLGIAGVMAERGDSQDALETRVEEVLSRTRASKRGQGLSSGLHQLEPGTK